MPKVKIDHIISFSSEDPVHVASNILSSVTSKKWKCQSAGEKNAVVVLQLEKATVITGIDIGNEHSAYVEILVSRSGTSDDYKVLLVTSSFMSPLESRQSQNVNKVRMFTKEHFSKPICDEKWDRVKIVCTQPFNKHVQYGLSFINIHTTEDKTSAPVQTHIGKFILRPESPDNLTAGSLFEKRKQVKQEDKLTGAAAIREASSLASLALYGSPTCKPKLKTNSTPSSNSKKRDSLPSNTTEEVLSESSKNRDRNELLYSKDEEDPNEKIDKIMERKNKEAQEKLLKDEKERTPKPKKQNESKTDKRENIKQTQKPLDVYINTPTSSKKKDNRKVENSNRKRKTDESLRKQEGKRTKKEILTKPFAQLLEGITLVISGIQNPDRANLRFQALSMGAKYKSDWDNTCTHLICAFTNTPKFNQVKGKGKIVKRSWLEDSYSQRKRLPWRRYALDKNDAGKESEDEISEKIDSPPPVKSTEHLSSDDDTYCDDHNDAGSDTEERIARIQEMQRMKENEKKNQNDVYCLDTDEESEDSQVKRVSLEFSKNLKNLFDNKKFYIDQTFDMDVYNNLLKYIIAYNGKSVDDPTEDIDIIIAKKENSKSLKEVNSGALCLSPDWVWSCHNFQKLVPVDEHVH